MNYIGIRQATVVQWVALRLIFEVYAGKKGYEGGVSGGIHGGFNRRQIGSFGQY